MVGKELIVHLPVFPLIACAVGCFMGFEGLFVNGFYGKVAKDILDLTRVDVISLDLRQRHTDVPGAVRSLVIGEVHERQLCVFIALIGFIGDT